MLCRKIEKQYKLLRKEKQNWKKLAAEKDRNGEWEGKQLIKKSMDQNKDKAAFKIFIRIIRMVGEKCL